MGLGRVRMKNKVFNPIIHKIFESNSSFLRNRVFQEFFASINKTFILAGRLSLGYQSLKFGQFLDIS